ncbi:MAG: ABC transporter ATP-binding protein/permease [Clostridiales bacterium]|jgi:ATP-binding cassette subfamily B protein|nr:ABC transporter ATP-binding protein/permease [Clostridiales bacterium]
MAEQKRNTFDKDEELIAKFNGTMLRKTLRYSVPYRRIMICMLIGMIVVGFLSLLPAMLNRVIQDYVILQQGTWGLDWRGLLVVVMIAWASIVCMEIVFAFLRMFFMTKAGHSMVRDIRRDTFVNLQRLAFDYYDNRPMGKILVRVTSYLDEVSQVFNTAILTILVDALRLVLILIWLFVLDWRLAIVVSILLVPMVLILKNLRVSVMKRGRNLRNKESNRTAYIAENIQGISITKSFNRAKFNINEYNRVQLDCVSSRKSLVRSNELFYPVADGFFRLGTIAVYGVSLAIILGMLPGLGILTVGTLVAFVAYLSMLSNPINNIALSLQQVINAMSNLERVFEVAETPVTVLDKDDAYELPPIVGHVSYQNVTFGYEQDNPILQGINLDVPAGKMIALVGATGAGKTTVVSLLSRFYELNSGAIKIDGHDIADVTVHSLRRQVGVMMQDSFIFSGTILDNIRYARPNATLEDCIAAAKKVYAHDFIEQLPEGYHTKTLEQGLGLSAGQKQLLSFARVVLTDPKILILDEATSNIDTDTESKIKKVLDEILVGRTSFVIAHRLSTIKKADCLLYIANRGIAEAGTHQQLMSKQGLYYALVNKV